MNDNRFPAVEPVEQTAEEREKEALIAAAVEAMRKAEIRDLHFILGYLLA